MNNKKDVEFNKNYWDAFYKESHRHTPSQFCVCVLTEINPEAVVVELGSGNGRDSHYFASQGHITVATDLSDQAIKSCKEVAESINISHSTFIQSDLTNAESVQKVIEVAREQAGEREIIYYSRFIMHSLDDTQEQKFLTILSGIMNKNEKVYFEFRSKQDADLKKHFGGHFRRYVDTAEFERRLAKLGFEIDYSLTGKGMAKFREEDPFVSRVIATK